MDQMLDCGRLSEFISSFIETTNEDLLWENYLHYPLLDMSFDEFKRRLGIGVDEAQVKYNLETTVKQTINILDSFVPEDY